MATYFARKAGNINAADVWATTPSGAASAVTFASGDVLVANSFAITVNVSTNLGSTGEVRNDTTGGAAAGGSFTLSGGVTLTASIYNGTVGVCVSCAAASPNVTTIVSDVIRNASSSGNTFAVSNTATGTLNITVANEVSGGTGGSGSNRAAGINSAGGGIVNITGTVRGGSSAGAPGAQANGGTLNITGNVIAATGPGVANMLTATCTITGSAKGVNSAGAVNESTGTLYLTKAIGSDYGPGNTAGLSSVAGTANLGLGVIEIQELEYGIFGQSPTSGTGIRLKKLGSNVAVFNYVDSGSAKTLIDATQANQPAASNVRSGVSYASGALTGTCAVPAAGSVALGVPVGSTTGTALLTQADVQAALTAQGLTTARSGNLDNLDTTVSSRLAPSGTLATVTNLTNAPASVTPSDIWGYASRTLTSASGPTAVQIRQEMDSNSTKLANLDTTVSSRLAGSAYTAPTTPPTAAAVASQVRTELGTELGRIDAAISTRATPANIPTADITAIKAKTDALNTTRLAQVSTTEIVGGLLAQANS